MTYQDYADKLLTISHAQGVLRCKSRTTVLNLMNSSSIDYVTISPNTASTVRLIIKDSLNKYIESKNREEVQ